VTFEELNELYTYLLEHGSEAALPTNLDDKWLRKIVSEKTKINSDDCQLAALTMLIYAILGKSRRDMYRVENCMALYEHYLAAMRKEITERLINCRVSSYNTENFFPDTILKL
jgi:hypothetical protein